jgi:SAM-dependent methyltransferase
MGWQTKCVIDSAKALLPFQAQLRRFKDSVTPYQPQAAFDIPAVEQGLRQIDWVNGAVPVKGATVMEVGSGWQPMIPVLYSLAGAAKVYLTDLNVLLRRDTFSYALSSLRTQRQMILDGLKLDPAFLDHSLRDEPSMSLEDRLKELRLVYMAPCDCRKMNLPAGSLDVVTSRACLEHVPPDVIQDIFHESHRLLRPGGVSCHIVDHSDHWEHIDKSLNRVNFLKYSDSFFKWTCINPLNYQNRLRHPEYLEMLEKAKLRLVREEHKVDQVSLRDLPNMQVDQRFSRFSKEELATIDTILLAVRD